MFLKFLKIISGIIWKMAISTDIFILIWKVLSENIRNKSENSGKYRNLNKTIAYKFCIINLFNYLFIQRFDLLQLKGTIENLEKKNEFIIN